MVQNLQRRTLLKCPGWILQDQHIDFLVNVSALCRSLDLVQGVI